MSEQAKTVSDVAANGGVFMKSPRAFLSLGLPPHPRATHHPIEEEGNMESYMQALFMAGLLMSQSQVLAVRAETVHHDDMSEKYWNQVAGAETGRMVVKNAASKR